MSRASWGLAGILVGVLGSGGVDDDVVRTRAVELVDERGDVVGRLAVTPSGAELVLGGRAQASLVSDGGLAALNLTGAEATVRLLAGDEAWSSLPACEELPDDAVVRDDHVGPVE